MKLQCGAIITDIPSIHLLQSHRERWLHWISALTSGEYLQNRDALRTNDRFCCMGVACDLLNPYGWIKKGDQFVFSLNGDSNKLDSSDQCLSPAVRRLYGGMGPLGFHVSGRFPDGNGDTVELKHFAITGLNDMGATFEELAEILTKAMSGGYSYKLKLLQTH